MAEIEEMLMQEYQKIKQAQDALRLKKIKGQPGAQND